jgi:pyruvate dehydrogenase E2 component (dihydrolipoamide acetyltransferase)/2-oxoglutarate dehydrogenase E2 component (dihydrolipoamide succinyltransferase)
MPQLGMAQDAGRIVSWLKAPGDAVAKGDALFEVETDKAVMEVESPADGFLGKVRFAAGDDVPVGKVIAQIAHSAESAQAAAAHDEAQDAPEMGAGAASDAPTEDLPQGHAITMPQLGMAQDSGLLVAWRKAPGDQVTAEDVLFEVETDKSTMEVEAGRAGWLAATLAEAGEEVPVGDLVAIIADEMPKVTVARGVKDAAPAVAFDQANEPKAQPAPAQEQADDPKAACAPSPATPNAKGAPVTVPMSGTGGRILASPKARRLAMEQGLDLARLVAAGVPQPYHVADLATLRDLPADAPAQAAEPHVGVRRLTAEVIEDGQSAFALWAAAQPGFCDADATLAGFAGASLGRDQTVVVAVERAGATRRFAVPQGRMLSDVVETEDAPDLVVRDLRATRLCTVQIGAEPVPVLSLTRAAHGVTVTLECAASAMDGAAAIALISEFAGRVEQPLRHLL